MIHKVLQWYLAFHKLTIKFPKTDRLTLGIKVQNLTLELLELLLLAKSKTGASEALILNKADIKLETIKLMVRVAHEAKALRDSGYAQSEEQLLEIGRIIGGWLKQTKNKGPLEATLFH